MKIFNNLKWYGVLYALWLILFARIDMMTTISGLFVVFAAVFYSERYLLHQPLAEKYPLNFRFLLIYYFNLIAEIYASGFQTIGLIVSGDINPAMVTIKTELQSEFYRAILANSITLTPGTVTVDKRGDQLTVLWLDATTDCADEAAEIIKGRLERQLKRGEQSCS